MICVIWFCICISFLRAAQLNPRSCGINDIAEGLIKVRIVGGDVAFGPGRWPWACSVGFFKGSSWKHKCGGSLITYEHVITAAHCITAFELNKWKFAVRCGDFNLENEKAQNRKVKDSHYYNQYKYPFKNNDIGILHLSKPFKPSKVIRPICLHEIEATPSLIVVGWGSTVENDINNTSRVLRESTQQKLDPSFCASTLTNVEEGDFENGAFGDDVFCAADPTGKQSGSCWGDSGGPIFSLNSAEKRYELIGIVNGGTRCGILDRPDIYTSTLHPPILQFIKDTVEGLKKQVSFHSQTPTSTLASTPTQQKDE